MIGIHKLPSDFYHHLCNESKKIVADKSELGYEYQLLWMSQHVSPIYVLNASDVRWYDIDDENDLKYAVKMILMILIIYNSNNKNNMNENITNKS